MFNKLSMLFGLRGNEADYQIKDVTTVEDGVLVFHRFEEAVTLANKKAKVTLCDHGRIRVTEIRPSDVVLLNRYLAQSPLGKNVVYNG